MTFLFIQEYSGACNAVDETLLNCEAPGLPHNSSSTQLVRLGLVMDGVAQLRTLNQAIQVYKDPVFFPLTNDDSSLVLELGKYAMITIYVRKSVTIDCNIINATMLETVLISKTSCLGRISRLIKSVAFEVLKH